MMHGGTGKLNSQFGQALSPHRCDDLEKSVYPKSLQTLDANSASLLKRLMSVTEEGLGVSEFAYNSLPILWVTDEAGEVLFSLEEVIHRDSREFLYPRSRNSPSETRDCQRLGHPALLQGKDGRIGGEILYDAGASPPAWAITNASGRYGTRPGRKKEHLSNVCNTFANCGIQLKATFYPPREG